MGDINFKLICAFKEHGSRLVILEWRGHSMIISASYSSESCFGASPMTNIIGRLLINDRASFDEMTVTALHCLMAVVRYSCKTKEYIVLS